MASTGGEGDGGGDISFAASRLPAYIQSASRGKTCRRAEMGSIKRKGVTASRPKCGPTARRARRAEMSRVKEKAQRFPNVPRQVEVG